MVLGLGGGGRGIGGTGDKWETEIHVYLGLRGGIEITLT